MAKVLISPLGVGHTGYKGKNPDRRYFNAEYRFSDVDRSYNTPFFAAALAEHLKVDKIILIGTTKSMWEEVYNYFTEKANCALDYDYWARIGDSIEKSQYNNRLINETDLQQTMLSVDQYLKSINPKAQGGSRSLIVDYGLNEGEIWSNFSSIMEIVDILDDGDELYFDITHAFRSIPLFMYLMMEFLQTLNYKSVSLRGLYYGMLDAKRDLGHAPVVDLSQLYQISQWIRATHDFINFGDGYTIGNLMGESGLKKAKETSKKIKNISELVNINYLTDLQQQISSLSSLIHNQYQGDSPIKYIIPLIDQFVSRFDGKDIASEFQLELSKWYFENRRYGHGYICLVESVLTKLCEVYKLGLEDIDNRERMKGLVTRRYYQRMDKDLKLLADQYNTINNVRNRIAHASFYSMDNYSFATDIRLAMGRYGAIKGLLNSESINNLVDKIPIERIKSRKN